MLNFDFVQTTALAQRAIESIHTNNISGNPKMSLVLKRVVLVDAGEIPASMISGENYVYEMQYLLTFGSFLTATPFAEGVIDECTRLEQVLTNDDNVSTGILTAMGIGATLNIDDINGTIVSPMFVITGVVMQGETIVTEEIGLVHALQVNRNVQSGASITSTLRFLLHWNNTLFRRPDGVEVIAEFKSEYMSVNSFQAWANQYNKQVQSAFEGIRNGMMPFASVYDNPKAALDIAAEGNKFCLKSGWFTKAIPTELLKNNRFKSAISNLTSTLNIEDTSFMGITIEDLSSREGGYKALMFNVEVLTDASGNLGVLVMYNPVPISTNIGLSLAYKSCRFYTMLKRTDTLVEKILPSATIEETNPSDSDFEIRGLYLAGSARLGGVTKNGCGILIRGLDIKYLGVSGATMYIPTIRAFRLSNSFSSVTESKHYMHNPDLIEDGSQMSVAVANTDTMACCIYMEQDTPYLLRFSTKSGEFSGLQIIDPPEYITANMMRCVCPILVNANTYYVTCLVEGSAIYSDVFEEIDSELIRSPQLTLALKYYGEYEYGSYCITGCGGCGSTIWIQLNDMQSGVQPVNSRFTILTPNSGHSVPDSENIVQETIFNGWHPSTLEVAIALSNNVNGYQSDTNNTVCLMGYECSGSDSQYTCMRKYLGFHQSGSSQTWGDSEPIARQLPARFGYTHNVSEGDIVTSTGLSFTPDSAKMQIRTDYKVWWEYRKSGGFLVPQ